MASQDQGSDVAPAKAGDARIDSAPRHTDITTHERDELDTLRELLGDLWFCHCEQHAIGGGPGWKEREQAAWARVAEHYEP